MRLYHHCIVLIILTLLSLGSCENYDNELPSASFSITPKFGDIETVFLFDASESLDSETESWRLKVRWDMDSNEEWESNYSVEKKFAFQFSKEGNHTITMEVLDSYGGITRVSKTLAIGSVLVDSSMIDLRDNQVYKTVRLWGRWYMAENLRYGDLLNTNINPSDNDKIESYSYKIDSTKAMQYGYFYTWNEATDYQRDILQGACPDGWHIINYSEFQQLSSLIRKFKDKYSFIREKGMLHLDFPLSGRYYYPAGDWDHQEFKGYFWVSHEMSFPWFSPWAYYNTKDTLIYRDDYRTVAWINHWKKEWGEYTYQNIALPVRCVKD